MVMDDETQPPALTIRCELQAGTLVVFVAGELDAASKGRLSEAADWRRHDVANVVIDMADLEFMDSTGISEIVLMNIAAEDQGVTVTARGARSQVRHVFDITGMGHFLDD